jgi:tetratricopeptide (TPR) repeat protein
VKSTRRQAALAAGVFALVLMSGPAVAGAQPGAQQMQRGGPPNPDTPRILVATFKSTERDIGVQAADAVRRRISDQNSGKVLWVVTKRDIDATLSQSGYKPDSALSTSDLMELGKQVRADEVLDATASRVPEGVKVEARLLIKRGQTILAQPLPAVTAKSAGDAARDIEKALADARKSIVPFKACENELRAQKYDAAAAQGRAALAAYPQSTFGRLCVLWAFDAAKAAPDSIISAANSLLSVDPTSIQALALAADAYKKKGDTDKSIEYSLRIYRADPSNQNIAQSIIQELATSGAPDKALPIVDELLKDNPSDPQMLRTKWLLLLGAKRYKEALATGEELVKSDTAAASLDYFTRMGAVATLDSQPQLASQVYARGVQKFPNDAQLQLAYAQSLARSGQLQQALAAAQRAVKINPKIENGSGYLYVLGLQVQLNQLDSAKATAPLAIANGADKEKISQTLLAVVAPAVKKANETKAREDWEAALKTAQDVDAIAAGPATKYFMGLSAFQIAAGAVNNMNDQIKEYQKAKPAAQKDLKPKICSEAKVAEDNLAIAAINMPAGGAYDKETAGQIMGALSQYSDFVNQVKSQLCK